MIIDAESLHFSALNEAVRACGEKHISIKNCVGQRYIAAGLTGREIEISGTPGNALGAKLNGGAIRVLGNHKDGKPIIGNFCGTGMHGGEIYLRCEKVPAKLPAQVRAERLEKIPQGTVRALVSRWCSLFGEQESAFTEAVYYRLTPDSENPYRQMYAFH